MLAKHAAQVTLYDKMLSRQLTALCLVF